MPKIILPSVRNATTTSNRSPNEVITCTWRTFKLGGITLSIPCLQYFLQVLLCTKSNLFILLFRNFLYVGAHFTHAQMQDNAEPGRISEDSFVWWIVFESRPLEVIYYFVAVVCGVCEVVYNRVKSHNSNYTLLQEVPKILMTRRFLNAANFILF